MKLCCGSVRTIKGAIALFTFCSILYPVFQLIRIGLACGQDVTNCIVAGIAAGVFVVLLITVRILKRILPACFPVACGHRRCVFTGRSSKSLQEILLLVGKEIPTEDELHQVKDKALLYLHDIKAELEKTMTGKKFQFIFSGSVVERYGIPFMLSDNTCAAFSFGPLHSDLDVMISSMSDRACFSGQGNIYVEPLFTGGVRFTGYAKLTTLTPTFETVSISSRLIINSVKGAVKNAPIANLPGKSCCVWAPKIHLNSKGPALKIRIPAQFEVDITFCIHCPEWPTTSDWPSRPRYWPSLVDVQRIMALGCHLVAKSAPGDKDQESWRFSFSLAEVELSKLVPDTARKCYLALKIILRDHLQPVVPEIGSYHIKTIFLNAIEKLPFDFWVEDNIEECFLRLLAELEFALGSMKCAHHWFSSINLFSIKRKKLQLLAKKVRRIQKDPSPFILDDGCCCLSSCCVRVPQDDFTRRGSQEFLVDCDEIAICVCDSENAITRVQDPRNPSFQSSVNESTTPKVPDISFPPNEEQLSSSRKKHGHYPDKDKVDSF